MEGTHQLQRLKEIDPFLQQGKQLTFLLEKIITIHFFKRLLFSYFYYKTGSKNSFNFNNKTSDSPKTFIELKSCKVSSKLNIIHIHIFFSQLI